MCNAVIKIEERGGGGGGSLMIVKTTKWEKNLNK